MKHTSVKKKHVKHNDFQLHTNCKSLTPVYKNLGRNSTCKLPIIDNVGEIVINHEALILHNVHKPQIHLGPLHCLIFALNSSRSFALFNMQGHFIPYPGTLVSRSMETALIGVYNWLVQCFITPERIRVAEWRKNLQQILDKYEIYTYTFL